MFRAKRVHQQEKNDNEREVAYDKDFKLSPLIEGLEVAAAEGINLVSMKDDWNEVFGK